MGYNEKLLFYLLRVGLGTESKFDFVFSEKPDWKFLFVFSLKHGLLSFVYDGLEYLKRSKRIDDDMMIPCDLDKRWGYMVMGSEKMYCMQFRFANELAGIYADYGIKTVVLKGIAAASFYPNPVHRPCGDFDCFLMGEYARGISVAVENGAVYKGKDRKHAHINYKGLEIEDHKFCTSICGPMKKKVFERNLQRVLYEGGTSRIKDSNLLCPNALFNALFLAEHTWRHYLDGEIRLRHLCDWAMLLKCNNCKIDWRVFKIIVDERDKNLIRFVKCMSQICHQFMGCPIPSIFENDGVCDDLSMHVLDSVMYYKRKRNLSNYGYLRRRYYILKRSWTANWQTKEFCEDSAFYRTFRLVYDYFFERNPHL